MLDPDEYVRKAYFGLLKGKGFGVYDMVLPKPVAIPSVYVLLGTQTSVEYSRTQCSHEWDCTILVEVIGEFENGLANRAAVDAVKRTIINLIDNWTFTQTDIAIPPFKVYNTFVEDAFDDFVATPTKTIVRKLIRFRHYLSSVA